jgi:hypothetical protein
MEERMYDLTTHDADPIYSAADKNGVMMIMALPDDDRLLPPIVGLPWLLIVGDTSPVGGSVGPTGFPPQLVDYIRSARAVAVLTHDDLLPVCHEAVRRAAAAQRGVIVIQTEEPQGMHWLTHTIVTNPGLRAATESHGAVWCSLPTPNRHQRRADRAEDRHRRTA